MTSSAQSASKTTRSSTARVAAASDAALPTLAIVGLGEVGRIYGAALHEVGHVVHGYDAYNSTPVEGIHVAASIAEAVQDADVVLVVTAAAASPMVAEEALEHIKAHATYVDCTSSAPTAKEALAARMAERRPDVDVVDVAILGPVISLGVQTPLMAAGRAAGLVVQLTAPFGCDVTVVDGGPGAAMAHKLLRSVFMKGLAAAVTEAVTAGRVAGYEEWIRGQIARELSGDGQSTIDRFLRGSVLHATRRADEMDAAAEYLIDIGVDNTMSTAAAKQLRGLQR